MELIIQVFTLKHIVCTRILIRSSAKYGAPSRVRYSIMVVRINATNHLVSSKPCTMCIQMMKRYRIKKVHYSTSDGIIISQKLSDITSDHVTDGLTMGLVHMSHINKAKIFADSFNKKSY
jgi:tRNA(Arg) A34 adenosine deaminase TadA